MQKVNTLGKGMGYKKSSYDPRDFFLKTKNKAKYKNLPSHYDSIMKHVSWRLDQGQTSSCVPHGWTTLFRYAKVIHNEPDVEISRLYLYWMIRMLEGDTNQDGGAEVRDGGKALGLYGVPLETHWPFEEDKVLVQPPQSLSTEASKDKALKYYGVKQTLDELKLCLFEGYPIVYGATLYESFESDEVAKTGVVPLPNFNTDNQVGGHCTVLVGYDDETKRFKGLNSWGAGWGNDGTYTIPYDYILNEEQCNDFWTLRLTSDLPKGREIIQPALKSKKVDLNV